jgi:hypothetical protein
MGGWFGGKPTRRGSRPMLGTLSRLAQPAESAEQAMPARQRADLLPLLAGDAGSNEVDQIAVLPYHTEGAIARGNPSAVQEVGRHTRTSTFV